MFFPWKESVFHRFCLCLLDNNQERVSEEMVRVQYKVTHTHWSRYPPTQLIRSRGRVGELFPSETTSIFCGSISKHHNAFCSGRQIPERHQPTTAAQLILGNWEHGGLIPWEPIPRISNTAHRNTEDVIRGALAGRRCHVQVHITGSRHKLENADTRALKRLSSISEYQAGSHEILEDSCFQKICEHSSALALQILNSFHSRSHTVLWCNMEKNK